MYSLKLKIFLIKLFLFLLVLYTHKFPDSFVWGFAMILLFFSPILLTLGKVKINHKKDFYIFYSIHWILGLLTIFLTGAVSFFTPITLDSALLLLLGINVFTTLYEDYTELPIVPKNLFKELLFAIIVFLAAFFIFHVRWKNGYTQMTDLYNHNTVSNFLSSNTWVFLPSQATPSIQINSYTTFFHTFLSYLKLSFTSINLYSFQQIIQPILFILVFLYTNHFIRHYIKNEYTAYFTTTLILLTTSPTPTFVHYSFVPNTFFLIIFFTLVFLLKKHYSKYIIFFIAFAMLLLHTFLFVISISFLILYKAFSYIKNDLNKFIFFLFCNIILLFLFIFSSKIPLLKTITNDKIGVLQGAINYTQFLTPLLISILILYTVIALIAKKKNTFETNYLYTSILYFIFSMGNLQFSERVGALAFPMMVISVFLILTKTSHFIFHKSNILFTIILLITQMLFLVKNNVDIYFNSQFWTIESHNSVKTFVKITEKEFDFKNNRTQIIAEPMSQMLLSSLTGVPAAGSYMLNNERVKVMDFFKKFDKNSVCQNNDYLIVLVNPRLIDWFSIKNIDDNVWYDFLPDNKTLTQLKSLNESLANNFKINSIIKQNNNFFYVINCF